MTALALNKSSLKLQREQLQMFERFLPSLDLKRQQLTGEYKRACAVLEESEQKLAEATKSISGLFIDSGRILHGFVGTCAFGKR